MGDLQIILAVFVIYLLLLMALAIWSSKETGDVAGFFIARKKLPFWVVAFSTNATGESGWLLLGLTGMAYAVGIHALWVVAGEVTGMALCWLLVAGRLKAATDRYASITVPDYLESRFADRAHVLRLLSVGIIVVMVLTYIAAQMVAAGKAFSDFMHISYAAGVALGALVTLLYTVIGGYKAVAYTDVLQGILMLLALILLPVVAIAKAGGLAAVLAALGSIDPALLQPMGVHGWSLAGVIATTSFLAIGLPFLGVPQILVRFMSIDDGTQVRRAAGISIVCQLFFTLGAVLIGISGRVLFPDLADPELVMPTMSRELFTPPVTGLLVVVLLAAIMSTVDSLLILVASAVTRDLLQKIVKLNISNHALAWAGRITTFVIGVGAMLIALSGNRAIFWFVLFSWSGLGAAFGPVILCSLFWRGVTLAGAVAGILGGFLTTIIWVVFLKAHMFNMYEMVPAFSVGMLLIIAVSLATNRPGSQGQFT